MARVRARRPLDVAEARDLPSDGAARVWALAVARAAQEELGIALELREVVAERRSLAELAELLPDPALIAVLDEGAGQATGVVVLDAMLTAGLVEALTTGSLSPSGDTLPRRPTRTDAAMLAPFLDRALAGFEAGLAAADCEGAVPRGYRFAAPADGARALLLLMEEGPFRLLRAEVVLGGGPRVGRLVLALPDAGQAARPRLETVMERGFGTEFVAQVEAAQVRMEAVLLRLSLPLGEMLALEVGQEIAMPQADIGRIALEGLDGRRVAVGRLGRQGGLRAIRLDAPAAEAEG